MEVTGVPIILVILIVAGIVVLVPLACVLVWLASRKAGGSDHRT